MSEMVERVARALTETQIRSANELFNLSDPRRVRTEEQIIASIESGWRMNERDARAAIEAMLEPTEAMILSQGKSKPENAATETQRERAEALNRSVRHMAAVTWREMIQAALKEQA